MVRTSITRKGQTTVPYALRRKWQTSQVLWELHPDGSAIVRPAPDVMKLFGAAGSAQARDPNEHEAAADAMAQDGQEDSTGDATGSR